MVDRGQLENAVLNLAINARDAMPDGGKLTIETANAVLEEAYAAAHHEVTAGRYVMVAVSDTGTGMPTEVAARAFEPFFTTKGVGRGTGLGLSMVYGFVKQTGGHVKIYSEPGLGTTVKIYLPRAAGAALLAEDDRAGRLPVPVGTESILVVEDDADVRAFVVAALADLGFHIREAADGPTAIAMLDRIATLDLLFTDVVLPRGMNGREVAEAVRRRFPDVSVLYTSGYTRNAVVHQGRLDPDVDLLAKPFTRETLVTRVRARLDARLPGRPKPDDAT
jgi:CheY-like chemotaxis protein